MEAKKRRKSQLARLRNRYIVAIYSGLSAGEGIRSIHRRLYEETIRQRKMGLAVSDGMLKAALSSTSSLRKKVGSPSFVAGYVKTKYGTEVDGITQGEMMSIFAFDLIGRDGTERRLSHEITVDADGLEGSMKDEAIGSALKGNRELDDPKVFYLASQHRDSASDHAPYQGKMYVDEKWRSSIKDSAQREAVARYIDENGVRTVQWVIGKPVWFVTRPNCRHYFKELSVNEVLATSRTKLIKKYDMKTAIGDRQYLQTIKHSTSKEWYDDVRNAQLLLNSYKERLSMHEMMYQENPCITIKNAIAKDRFLIRKWEKYIDEKTK